MGLFRALPEHVPAATHDAGNLDTAEVKWLEADPRVAGRSRPADSVNLWWGFFLGRIVLSNLVTRRFWNATTAKQTLNATIAFVLADGVDVVAAVITILLVSRVTELQLPLVFTDNVAASSSASPSGAPKPEMGGN